MQTLYTRAPETLVLDNQAKRYVLTIHDLPLEEKPREKLKKYGPKTLSTAELLAVVLGTGTKKEDVLSMSTRVMREYGEKSIMSSTNPEQLVENLSIPEIRATQIVACAELGRRFYKKNSAGSPTIRTASDVFAYVADMRDLPKEHLRGIYLNAHYKVVHDEVISIGTIDTSIIHPREVFRPALEYATAAVILVHNHPSGSTKASEADKAITEQLVAAGKLLGIDLVDHVIVTKSSFASVPVDYK